MTEECLKELSELNKYEIDFMKSRREILKSLYDIKNLLGSQGCHVGETENKIQEAIFWLELEIKNNQSGIDFQKQRLGAL